MIRLITRGRFTQDYTKGLIEAPEDREPAVRKLIEATGGKLVSFYFTTGESDFLLIAEADDAESLLAALMATAAAGTISDVTTARAWTGAEFKSVAAKASKAASRRKLPIERCTSSRGSKRVPKRPTMAQIPRRSRGAGP